MQHTNLMRYIRFLKVNMRNNALMYLQLLAAAAAKIILRTKLIPIIMVQLVVARTPSIV